MDFNFLKTIWKYLDKLSPDLLRLLVFFLIFYIFICKNTNSVENAFEQKTNSELKLKQDREQYVVEITPKINDILQNIAYDDENATNVILLNYHNTLVSSHGLAYKYLTGLCEQFKEKPCIDYWKELDYMNYGEEIHRIIICRYLLMQDIVEYRAEYPKLTYLLERSGAKSAVFYPVIGVEGSVGMLIIIYNKKVTEVSLDHMRNIISPNIQPLAVLLDYDYFKGLKK